LNVQIRCLVVTCAESADLHGYADGTVAICRRLVHVNSCLSLLRKGILLNTTDAKEKKYGSEEKRIICVSQATKCMG
jgi:hypothetical protein